MLDIGTPPPRPAESTRRPDGSGRERADTSTRDLALLLGRRPELCGVHAPADLLADRVTWSA